MYFYRVEQPGVFYVLVGMTDTEFDEKFDTIRFVFTVRRISKIGVALNNITSTMEDYHNDFDVIMDTNTYKYWCQDGEIDVLSKPNPRARVNAKNDRLWKQADACMTKYALLPYSLVPTQTS